MKLERLSVCGITRFTDETTIDLGTLPPGLIAITGENGAGKTTVIESIFGAWYRRFPSRERELFDYATRTDAFIQVDFTLEGVGTYRSRLNLDAKNRKAEAVLVSIAADGSPLQVLNDGKVTTYDQAIRKLLPPPELLLASTFAAQNRNGSFVSLDRKGRKDLFAKLLGLELYAEYYRRASEAVRVTATKTDDTELRVDYLEQDASDEMGDQLAREAATLADALAQEEHRCDGLRPEIAAGEDRLARLQADVTAYEIATRDVERLSGAIARAAATVEALCQRDLAAEEEAELSRVDEAFTTAVRRNAAWAESTQGLDDELAAIEHERAAIHADTEKRIAKNRTQLLDREQEIRTCAAALPVLDEILAERRQALAQHGVDEDALSHRQRERSRLLFVARTASAQLVQARQQADLIVTVPFGEQCAEAGCRFVENAAAAKARIPELEAETADVEALQREVDEIERAYLASKTAAADQRRLIQQLETDLRAAQSSATHLVSLETAHERIRGYVQQQTDADAAAQKAVQRARDREQARQHTLRDDLRALTAAHAQDRAAIIARYLEIRQQHQAAIAQARADVEDAERQSSEAAALVALHADAEHESTRIGQRLATARDELQQAQANVAAIRARQEDLHARRDRFTARRAELDQTRAQLQHYRDEQTEWMALARFFGPNGLPVIEIDAAGPAISALTNDFLTVSGFGFLVAELVTQTEKLTKGKDGDTMKDVFELHIHDARSGGARRDLSDLSGGEQVIVDEALKLAIAVYVNQRQAAPMRTMFRDETTGALDGERALAYVAMLRRAYEIGRFHHIFYITHNPDAAQLGDARIGVSPNHMERAA